LAMMIGTKVVPSCKLVQAAACSSIGRRLASAAAAAMAATRRQGRERQSRRREQWGIHTPCSPWPALNPIHLSTLTCLSIIHAHTHVLRTHARTHTHSHTRAPQHDNDNNNNNNNNNTTTTTHHLASTPFGSVAPELTPWPDTAWSRPHHLVPFRSDKQRPPVQPSQAPHYPLGTVHLRRMAAPGNIYASPQYTWDIASERASRHLPYRQRWLAPLLD